MPRDPQPPPKKDDAIFPVKLPQSRRTLYTRRVAAMTLNETQKQFREQFPAPKPPLNSIPQPDGSTILVPNESDPDYQAALKKHALDENERMMRVIIRRGVILTLDEEQSEEVRQFREDMAEEGVDVSHLKDRSIYIFHIALQSHVDLQYLVETIVGRSIPTEEKIAEASATFRGDAQGA